MLPPRDPHEPSGLAPDFEVPAPTTMYLNGRPSRAEDRVADAILTARPGLLIVFTRR